MSIRSLESALSRAWSKETSADPKSWTPANPSWGQCAITACVVNDYLGGKVVWAEAALPDGRKLSHYFNEVGGNQFDLTRQQFPEGTVIPAGVDKKKEFETTRGYVLSFEKTRMRYDALKERVELILG